jgi:hypothetical protein
MEYCVFTKEVDGTYIIWNSNTDKISEGLDHPKNMHHFELQGVKRDDI